jgi:hypothetical protein
MTSADLALVSCSDTLACTPIEARRLALKLREPRLYLSVHFWDLTNDAIDRERIVLLEHHRLYPER